MSLDPYTAVLFASYGGPDKPDDVLPFMRNATAGRGIPDERLLEVSEHYHLFGGKSPINELNAQLMADVSAELERRGMDVPVVIGNRNWKPYMRQTIEQLVADGHRRVVAVATSAYSSYSSCRQYLEDIERGSDGLDITIDKVGPFAETEAFAQANARSLVAAVRTLREQIGQEPMRVLFVTHSIPTAMNQTSADGTPEHRYDAQHLRVAGRVAELASAELDETLDWELTFCSRSGAPHIPWLEPDINDRLPEVRDEGVKGVVAAPIGFISDHMEVLYDLDTEARTTAAELELPYVRAATVGTDPGFIALIADTIEQQAADARHGNGSASGCQSNPEHCLPRPKGAPQHGHPGHGHGAHPDHAGAHQVADAPTS